MSSSRETYRHGDLRNALIQAGLDLARDGGADALVLREATRRAGVSPNAAYRHFPDRRALVQAVAARAQEQLADVMLARMAAADVPDTKHRARARLHSIGLAYIEFAIAEPGLFQVAFQSWTQFADPDSPAGTPASAPPFRLLVAALDDLVLAGMLAPEQRRGAEWACWSTVHGAADLATRGPLRALAPAELAELAESVVTRIIDGVMAAPHG